MFYGLKGNELSFGAAKSRKVAFGFDLSVAEKMR